MKKTLLASVVTGLILAGCGGGGSSSGFDGDFGGGNGGNGNNGGDNGTGTPKPTYTLTEMTDFDNEHAQNWYQFNESDFYDYSTVTHPNYQDPYEFAFKDNKIFSKLNSSMDTYVYPTYMVNGAIIEHEVSDTADNINNMQRVGILQNKPDLIGSDGNERLVMSFKPYKGNSELVINMTYKVKSLEGKKLGQTINPSLYQAVNDSPISADIIKEPNLKRYIPAVWDKHSSKLSSKTFSKNTACLTLEKVETNYPTFFAKHGGRVSGTERIQFEKDNGLTIGESVVDPNGNTISTALPNSEPAYEDAPTKMTMVLSLKNQPSYTAVSYIGSRIDKFMDGNNTRLNNLEIMYNEILTSSAKEGWTISPTFSAYFDITEQNVGNGCDLYNREARNQVRDFLVDLNKRTD